MNVYEKVNRSQLKDSLIDLHTSKIAEIAIMLLLQFMNKIKRNTLTFSVIYFTLYYKNKYLKMYLVDLTAKFSSQRDCHIFLIFFFYSKIVCLMRLRRCIT